MQGTPRMPVCQACCRQVPGETLGGCRKGAGQAQEWGLAGAGKRQERSQTGQQSEKQLFPWSAQVSRQGSLGRRRCCALPFPGRLVYKTCRPQRSCRSCASSAVSLVRGMGRPAGKTEGVGTALCRAMVFPGQRSGGSLHETVRRCRRCLSALRELFSRRRCLSEAMYSTGPGNDTTA